MKAYTDKIKSISKELNISMQVAMDIEYLREIEKRIIKVAKEYPSIEDFDVVNNDLETQLENLELLIS